MKSRMGQMAELQSQLADQEEDIEQLVLWLDELEHSIPKHFQSWSWRIGWFVVWCLKKLVFRSHPQASSYRFNLIFEAYRKWKSLRPKLGADVLGMATPRDFQVSVLAGDCSDDLEEKVRNVKFMTANLAPIQVLAFRFNDSKLLFQFDSIDSVEVNGFCGSRFPVFHESFASALLRAAGDQLIVLASDLPALGLGLLVNFHFGTPLYLVAPADQVEVEPVDNVSMVDWADADFLNPVGEMWRRVMASFVSQVPGGAIEAYQHAERERSVLPAAERFARLFSKFYEKTRGYV